MRRNDRQVTAFTEILDIIKRCNIIHLGMCHNNKPYIVPLNFGYTIENETIIFYFHSAKEGKKMDILKNNPDVCFEMVCNMSLVKDISPCNWTTLYETVMGEGSITFIEDDEQKRKGFATIMQCNGFEGEPKFTPELFNRTQLYQLKVENITAKRNSR